MEHFKVISDLMRRAGKMILPYYGNVNHFEQKSDNPADVVTELDRKVEVLFRDDLCTFYPQIGFFGEEYGGEKSNDYWLMDPIDGTAHFMRGMPFCTIMIARIKAGQPVFSAIYNFVNDQLYVAAFGEGAWMNGKRLSVSNRPLSASYCALEINLNHPKGFLFRQELEKRNMIAVQTINCGFEFAMVASGKWDGRICFSPYGKEWDYAPGVLLVQEAGGVVKNFGSDSFDLSNRNFYATNPVVSEHLEQLAVELALGDRIDVTR